MAVIDSKKLLPPSKSSGNALATQKFLVPISNIKVKSSAIIKASDIKPLEKTEGGGGGKIVLSNVLQIRESVVSIQRLIGSNTALLQQSEERERKLLEKEKFESKEKKLEGRKGLSIPQLKSPSLPRTGFLDAIKRFLFYTLLGAAFVKFGKHIPKILGFSKKLIPAFKFVENFAGNILNGAVEFIDKGYKAYDKVREISKTIGGEDLQKKFDEFSKQFNTFANLAIIAGMATMGGTDFKKDSDGRTGGSYTAGYAAGLASRGKGPRYRSPGQAAAGGTFGENLQRQSLTRDRMLAPTGPRGPLDAINRRFRGAAAQLETGTLFKRGAGFQRALYSAPGKLKSVASRGGAVGKFAGKALGRVPIIGGLIDFIISTVIFKEKPGRAAAKAVGSTIGAALGTFVPVPFAGTILGGVLGDIVGGALYDTLVGSKSPEAKAQGGQVTRGGRKVSGPAKRTIKRVKAKPPKVKPQKTIPGKDVGGKKEIEKLFPYSINPNQKSPLGVLETTSESLKKVPLLGGVMGASLDLVMGQKPDAGVFKKIGYGFGALIQNAIDAETSNTIGNIQKEIVGLAGGGAVPRTLSSGGSIGMKIGEQLAKSLEVMMNAKVSETLQSIRQQFSKADMTGVGPGPLDPTGPDVFHGMGAERMWNFFKNKGLSDFAVAGIMGNARWESSFNPTARGEGMGPGGSDALGIFQWGETARWKDLVNWATSQNLNPWDYDTQLKFAWHEMQTTEKATIPAIQGATSAADAAEKFRAVYERSKETEQRRKDAAEGFYQQYKGKTYIPISTSRASAPGNFNVIEYITGDPRTPTGRFDRTGHGMPSNYHDHIAFKTKEDKERAKKVLRDAGIKIGSEYRPGDPGYHGAGLAIDIPGYQWKGTGKIGEREFSGSKKVRQVLGLSAFEKGGKVLGLTRAILGEKGPEFVLDANTTAALEQNYPGFLDALNKADYKGALNVLSNYTSYYNPSSSSMIMLQKVIIEKPVPVAGGGMISGGVNNSSASTSPITASLYSA